MRFGKNVSEEDEKASFKALITIVVTFLGSVFLFIGGLVHLEKVLTNGKPLFYLSFDKAMRGISFVRGAEPEINTGANIYEVFLIFLASAIGAVLAYYCSIQYNKARKNK